MTATPAYCASCGQPQAAGRSFCSNCGQRLGDSASGTGQSLTRSMLDLQRFWWKVQAGRLLGIVVGLAAWWFVVGPASGGSPLIVFGALILLPFLGMWLGGQIALEAIAGARK